MVIKKIGFAVIAALMFAGFSATNVSALTPPPNQHFVGTNVVDANGTVYLITPENEGTSDSIVRRPYTSAGAFLSYSYNSWGSVQPIWDYDVTLPVGNPIPPRDGTIICSDRGSDKGTCYLITNGYKAGFTSLNVFTQLGFRFTYAYYGDVSFLGAPVNISSGTSVHLPGTVVNKDGTVYLISSFGLRAFSNWPAFISWGYWDGDIILANSADRNLPMAGSMSQREAGQIRPPSVSSNNLTITDNSMPDGNSGEDYTHTFKATGGVAPYVWENFYTTHPCCYVGINSSTGKFSNTGTNLKPLVGSWQIGIKVTDAAGATYSKVFSWNVFATNLKITTTAMSDGKSGQDYSTTFKASGGTAPYTWEIYYITHPCCYVSMQPSTGVFSNAGSGLKPLPGTWQVGIKVTDSNGAFAQQVYTWKIVQ
jgi:hypothetical protein